MTRQNPLNTSKRLKTALLTVLLLLGVQLAQASPLHEQLHDHMQHQADCLLCHQFVSDTPVRHQPPVHPLLIVRYIRQATIADTQPLDASYQPRQSRAPPSPFC